MCNDTYKGLTAEQWHNAYHDLKRKYDKEIDLSDIRPKDIPIKRDYVVLRVKDDLDK